MLTLQLKEKTYSRTFSLRNIQMNVEKGRMMLLLGHNGAGKTTMINPMFGLTPFYRARILKWWANKASILSSHIPFERTCFLYSRRPCFVRLFNAERIFSFTSAAK